MAAVEVDATLQVEDALGDLVNLRDPNPTLVAILALLADRTVSVTLQRVAAVALSGHRLVTPDDDGELVYATNADLAAISKPVWLTTAAWDADDLATVTALGVVTEGSWAWTPGTALFLGTAGQLTAVPPVPPAAFAKQVATAVSPTSVFVNPSPPIQL